MEPEEKPVIVHDHGIDTDEAHHIDTAAGDEGIDDEVGDDFDNNGGSEKQAPPIIARPPSPLPSFETMKTISPTAAADTPPLPEKPEPPFTPPPIPEKPEPIITPPPLEPEEKPIVVHDHGVDTDEAHDIDKAAGDEGIDDEEKGEFTDPSAAD